MSKKRKIICKIFSKQIEGRKTGADIELWVITNNGNYAYRLQAKKISAKAKKNAEAFTPITAKGKKSQYDMLVKDAIKERMTPLYMFYQSGYTGMLCSRYSKDCGAIVTDAFLYSDYAHKTKHSCDAVDIVQQSYPLPCLLCFNKNCQKHITHSPHDGNLPKYVTELLESNTIENFEDLESCNNLIVFDLTHKQESMESPQFLQQR